MAPLDLVYTLKNKGSRLASMVPLRIFIIPGTFPLFFIVEKGSLDN